MNKPKKLWVWAFRSRAAAACLSVVSALLVANAAAQDSVSSQTSVAAIALFKDRVMISVNGEKAKIVRAGDTHEGVTVVSSNTDEAVVEVNGQQETLTLNGGVLLSQSLGVAPSESYANELQLFVNEQGFFQANGEIDGKSIEFLIDTGANIVVLSSWHADRIGLEYQDGVRSYASTASGTAPMYVIEVGKMSVGGIQLERVRAGVIVGRFPEIPLLGMTYLSRLDINRSGNTMTLKRR